MHIEKTEKKKKLSNQQMELFNLSRLHVMISFYKEGERKKPTKRWFYTSEMQSYFCVYLFVAYTQVELTYGAHFRGGIISW